MKSVLGSLNTETILPDRQSIGICGPRVRSW